MINFSAAAIHRNERLRELRLKGDGKNWKALQSSVKKGVSSFRGLIGYLLFLSAEENKYPTGFPPWSLQLAE